MATSIIPEMTLNTDIMVVLSDMVWAELEGIPEYRDVMDAFGKVTSYLQENKRATHNQLRALEDAPISVADVYGTAMFKLGLSISSDPMRALTLPQLSE